MEIWSGLPLQWHSQVWQSLEEVCQKAESKAWSVGLSLQSDSFKSLELKLKYKKKHHTLHNNNGMCIMCKLIP